MTVGNQLIEKAISIATKAHKGQTDKVGAPYILHPLRVMLRGKTQNEMLTGILHDVVEDCNITFEQLQNEGFPPEVIEALRCVTKTSPDEDYTQFINRVATNQLAIYIKIYDLEDNMNVLRMQHLTTRDMERLQKYIEAHRRLIQLLHK